MLDRPRVLLLLLILLLVALAWRFAYLRGRQSLRALGGRWRYNDLLDVYVFKSFFTFLFFCFFFAGCVLALAGFRWGDRLVEERRSGQELVVVLDVSNSMLAEDGGVSRLERSLATLRRVVRGLEGARIALVVFKGEAVQLLPLTEDRSALQTALRYVGPSLMTAPGSALQAGIEKSLSAFPSAGESYRAVLLFTDGEHHSGNPLSAALRAGKEGIPLYVVAVGSEQGTPLQIPGRGVLLDGAGNPVITRLDRDILENISELSAGRLFWPAEDEQKVAEQILGALKGQREGDIVLRMRREKKDRYRFFLFLALLFLGLSTVVKALRWRQTL